MKKLLALPESRQMAHMDPDGEHVHIALYYDSNSLHPHWFMVKLRHLPCDAVSIEMMRRLGVPGGVNNAQA